MRKRRERITKGFAAVDDRTVWTLELNRDELMIILNGIKNHRIKGAACVCNNGNIISAITRHSKENNRMNPRALSLRFISLVVVRLFDTLENNLPVIRAVGQCRL